MLTGKSQFHISTPLGIEPGSLMMGSKGLTHWTSDTVYECSEIAGSPQGSPPAADYVDCEAGRKACSERETRTEEEIKWSGIITLSARQHDSLVTVWDKTRLRRGHNDQSRQGHKCSETTLTGESRLHISTPLGIENGSLMTGSIGITHWTSETVYECREIAGSPQTAILIVLVGFSKVYFKDCC